MLKYGDYVNGSRVIEIFLDGERAYLKIEGNSKRIYNEDIKNVVTHEEFENIKYKVGE